MKGTNYTLYNDLVMLGLDQLICEVIRPESNSCLDDVYVNNPSNVLTFSVTSFSLSVTAVGKHNGSFFKTNVHKTNRYRDFKNFYERRFTEQLTNAPWSLINMTDDVYRAAKPMPRGH